MMFQHCTKKCFQTIPCKPALIGVRIKFLLVSSGVITLRILKTLFKRLFAHKMQEREREGEREKEKNAERITKKSELQFNS